MIRILTQLALALVLSLSTAAAAELRFSTFNIRWYGLGGSGEGVPGREPRDSYLKRFVERALGESDVIAFQEIVDVARLKREVLGKEFKCVSYAHPRPTHQHVVLCYRRELTLSLASGEGDYLLEDVAHGKYRPAVLGLLRGATGRPLAHVVALHLKAGPDHSELRLRQAELVARAVARLSREGVPVIVLGDLNTHKAGPVDDEPRFDRLFATVGLERVPNAERYTYRSRRFRGRFDHIYVSQGLAPTGRLVVDGPCNRSDEEAVYRYNRAISDHCPISVTLSGF